MGNTHFRELEYRHQIDQLSQPDLVIVFCSTIAALDDQHLEHALRQISDDDLGTLVAKGIIEQRERENAAQDAEAARAMPSTDFLERACGLRRD